MATATAAEGDEAGNNWLRGGTMRSEQEVNSAIERYAGTVRRLCTVYLKNDTDTEDIFQTVFLKYVLCPIAFRDQEHEKAWLIRVTINACKDQLRSFFRSHTVPLEAVAEQAAPDGTRHREVLEAVLSLPQRCRDVVYLHYYEGYTAPEIGRMLGRNVNTVYTLLTRSKKLLREKLGGDGDG